MKELTTYLVESLVCGGVLYACYRLLLDRRISFGWNPPQPKRRR